MRRQIVFLDQFEFIPLANDKFKFIFPYIRIIEARFSLVWIWKTPWIIMQKSVQYLRLHLVLIINSLFIYSHSLTDGTLFTFLYIVELPLIYKLAELKVVKFSL